MSIKSSHLGNTEVTNVTSPRSSNGNSKAKPAEAILEIPLIERDGSFSVTQKDVDEWQETYPGIDVLSELKKARQWSLDNPRRRKTKNGIRRHLTYWLSRAQDRALKLDHGQPDRNRPQCRRLLN